MAFKMFKQYVIRFLRWSQRYTKTDMVYLTKGSFWLMTKQVFLTVFSFGMAIAFANLVLVEVYGTYKYVLTVAILLSMTTMSGINTALTRSVARGAEGSVLSALFSRMRWGLVGSIITMGIVLYYGLQGNTLLMGAFAVVALFLPLKSSFSVYQAYWQGKQRFDTFSKLAILQEFMASGVLLVVLFLTNDVFLLLLAYFSAQTLASAALCLYTIRKLENRQQDKEVIHLGKHLSVNGLLFSIVNNSGDIILWHTLGPSAVAMFAFANRPPHELARIFTEAFPLALPKFSQRSKEEIRRTLLPKILKLYPFLILAAVGYFFIAPFVFRWFFPAYQEAVVYSQLLSFQILFVPLSLFAIVFQALGRTRELYINSLMSPLVLIPCLAIGAWLYGLMGFIVGWYVSIVVGMVVNVYLFKRM